ncbi:MAG: dethiobiotin synthase [Burkholderiales bacterium]
MSLGFFVTGTDTGVGKTRVACALLHAFAAQGKITVGMKPVAAGCAETAQGLRSDDVEALRAASRVKAPRDLINPYAFKPAIAPHIAARQAGIEIDMQVIKNAFNQLTGMAEVVIVEGVGGFKVPLNSSADSADLAGLLGLPVILVVGMRLGCLNHALLTAEAIESRGLQLAAWVANCLDPRMQALEENLAALEKKLEQAPLSVLEFAPNLQTAEVAAGLAVSSLDLIGKAVWKKA